MSVSIAFEPKTGLVVIPAKLSGPKGDAVIRVALDTGATSTLVGWDWLILTGYEPASTLARVRVTTGSGVEFAPRVVIQKIEALEREVRNFPIVCHTLPPSATVDGLLGLDFLRGQRLVVDFRAGTIALD